MRKSALSIVRESNRFDLGIKINYATAYLELAKIPPRILNHYLTHIQVFNSFNEQEPAKNSPGDFTNSFNNLINNINQIGFDGTLSRVHLSPQGELIDAAHRVAASAVMNIEVETEIESGTFEIFDFKYFLSKKLPIDTIHSSLLGYSTLASDLQLIIIWPVTPNAKDDFIHETIEEEADIYCKLEFTANENLVNNIKIINYYLSDPESKNSWVGNPDDGFAGISAHAKRSMGNNSIRIFVLKNTNYQTIVSIKNKLREGLHLGNFSVHGTDSNEESQRIIQTLCHPESLFCAQSNDLQKSSKLIEWIFELQNEMVKKNLEISEVIVGGSGAIGAHGVREISDLDLICKNDLEFESGLSFVSFHKLFQSEYETTYKELLFDPEKHFYFLGLKFMSLSELLIMKRRRNEKPKDKKDVKIIEMLLTKKDKRLSIGRLGNRIQVVIYWEMKNFRTRIFNSLKSRIAKSPALYRFLKKTKNILSK
jgi:hypothetical protein